MSQLFWPTYNLTRFLICFPYLLRHLKSILNFQLHNFSSFDNGSIKMIGKVQIWQVEDDYIIISWCDSLWAIRVGLKMGEPRIKLGDSWHRNLVKKGVYLAEVWLGDIQQLRGPNFNHLLTSLKYYVDKYEPFT